MAVSDVNQISWRREAPTELIRKTIESSDDNVREVIISITISMNIYKQKILKIVETSTLANTKEYFLHFLAI